MSVARQLLALVLAFGCACAGCGDTSPKPAPRAEPQAPVPEAEAPETGKREILVLAASSLVDAFKELKRVHEREHPEVEVLLSFAGSSALAAQVGQGGVGDVLATASEEHMQALAQAGHVKGPAVFAYNELILVVPLSNPEKLKSFADLPKAKRIVLGAANVPAGKYADELLQRAGDKLGAAFRDTVNGHVVSREANVRLVLSKVELGEADAAIVYRTDILQAGCTPSNAPGPNPCERAHPIEIPEELAERATYPIALLSQASEPALGRAFIDYVLSNAGQAVLAAHGFITARAAQPESPK